MTNRPIPQSRRVPTVRRPTTRQSIGPNDIAGSITLDGHPFGTGTLSVSADGKTLTITQAGPAGSGDSLSRVYEKQ